jgi:hypothetical protein
MQRKLAALHFLATSAEAFRATSSRLERPQASRSIRYRADELALRSLARTFYIDYILNHGTTREAAD